MAFGWSVGDIIAGLKIVQDVYASVNDGYLNAQFQATGFFNEFADITQRLDDWKQYKEAISQKESLAQSYPLLKKQCEVFIKRHFLLIQESNPETQAKRPGRSTWLKKASFTRDQIELLYAKVTWPAEQKTVSHLRTELQYVLNLAIFDLGREANIIGRENHAILHSLSQDHRELVNSYHQLSHGIAFIIKQITDPFGESHRLREVDNSILRQLENALPRPETIQAIEAPPSESSLPWHNNSLQPAFLTPAHRPVLDANTISELADRIDNIGKRLKRVETLDTINETGIDNTSPPPINELLNRLRCTRGLIQDQVAVPDIATLRGPSHWVSAGIEDPEDALRIELGNWERLKEQMKQETIHNQSNRPRLSSYAASSTQFSTPDFSALFSAQTSAQFSPLSSPSLQSNSRQGSLYSLPRPHPNFLDRQIPVIIDFPYHELDPICGFIDAIPGYRDGIPRYIQTISGERSTTVRHFIHSSNAEGNETLFIPYLDNGNVDNDHQFRLHFQGQHSVDIGDGVGNPIPTALPESPNYNFFNENDFNEFQKLLLGKTVKCNLDTITIHSTDQICQCREESIRVLLDEKKQTRYILYFKPGKEGMEHEEWPVSCFEAPKEPPKPKNPADESKRYRILKISSYDGKSLSNPGRISRRSTGGSIVPGSPTESPHKSRNSNRGIKGLEIEFYSHQDCHQFWTEFTAKDVNLPTEMSFNPIQNRDRRRSTIERSPWEPSTVDRRGSYMDQ